MVTLNRTHLRDDLMVCEIQKTLSFYFFLQGFWLFKRQHFLYYSQGFFLLLLLLLLCKLHVSLQYKHPGHKELID